MAEHFDERKWRETLFQFFLNGKNNFKIGRLVARLVPLAAG